MSVTRFILGNRHAVLALAIAAVIFGGRAYFQLPMQLFPDTAPPLVNVITMQPGAAAEEVAQDLSRRLEEEFASLEGIVNIRSSSQDNLSLVSLEFHYDRDVDLAAVDVQNAIARIRGTLPPGIREPQVLKFSVNDRPVISLGVSGPDLKAARRLAEEVFAPRLQRLPGVAAVDVFGGNIAAVMVEVEARKLEAHRIPLSRVVDSIRRNNVSAPAGQFRGEGRQTMFRLEARARDLEELGRIPLATGDGSRVLLADLGRISLSSLDDDSRFRIDGTPVVGLQVFKTTEANTVKVVGLVKALIGELGREYPDLRFLEGEESATFTETVVNNLLTNVWQALLLASIIIFLFLRKLLTSLVVVVSMPLSFAITFALMRAFDLELNMVTLSGVILAVGMVVDGSVVVIENISRRREAEGLSPLAAAAAGAEEMTFPVVGGVATTLVVLVPMLFLSGFTGKTFGPLSATLICAFVSSLVVALVLVPTLASYFIRDTRLDRGAELIFRPFTWLMDRVLGLYLLLLQKALKRRLIAVAIALALFAIGLLGIKTAGMDVLTKMDSGSFFVSLETPSGSAVEETERVAREVENILGEEPEVTKIQSQIGFEQGMRSLSLFGVQGPTQAFITVTLTPRNARKESVWEIQERVREKLATVPGIRSVTVRELGNTAKATTSAPILISISGPDARVLDLLADEAMKRMQTVNGVAAPMRNWRIDQERVQVQVDQLRAAELGLSPADLSALMSAGADGAPAGEYYGEPGRPLPVRVRYSPAERGRFDFPVFAPGAPTPVPLRSLIQTRETVGQGLITREGLSPAIEVSAFVHGRPVSFVVRDVEKALADISPPRGFNLELTGEKKDMAESSSQIGGALAVAVIAIYLLLTAQFRSFLHPLTVLMTVPLSLFGVAAALWIAGRPVSMPVLIGLILLVGIIVNNAIILIDFINTRRKQGMKRREALLGSVKTRFRPIMMTALSTMAGMIPLAAEWSLGAERFSSLAIAVLGGLLTATFLTLIVIPVLYDLFDDAAARFSGPKQGKRRPARRAGD